MMQHLERAAKRFYSKHARAYAKIDKNPQEAELPKNACVARIYSCKRCKKCALGIAHSACRGILQQWLLHHSEPSDY